MAIIHTFLVSKWVYQHILISNFLGAESIGGIFNTLIQIEDHGNRVLVEQSAHEMKKGSFDIALRYLDKALSVSTRLFIVCLFIYGDESQSRKVP